MTLLQIKTQAAAILERELSDFTVGGIDLWLAAANQVRKTAELGYDFEFNRRLVTVAVNGATGGSLEDAEDGEGNPVEVKTVLEVGLLDENQNLIPVSWTTVAAGLETQRSDNGYTVPRYPRDGDVRYGVNGASRFTFSGDSINRWPISDETEGTTYPLWMEVYAFSPDWLTTDLAPILSVTMGGVPEAGGSYVYKGIYDGKAIYQRDNTFLLFAGPSGTWNIASTLDPSGSNLNYWSGSPTSAALDSAPYGPQGTVTGTLTVSLGAGTTSDIWTTHGAQFLLWSTIVHLNKLFKVFVPRQEGNLPPPTDLADAGLQTLVDWDSNKFEQFRRHNR